VISIIDYGVGNIKAFANIYKTLDIDFAIATCPEDLQNTTKIILPGVGSFDHAIQQLLNSGMKEKLDSLVLHDKIPVLGICVGMQMLAKRSEEGILPGLGWIDGIVKKFDKHALNEQMPLPHMGWNTLNIQVPSPLLTKLEQNPAFYFLHSYYFECTDDKDVLASTSYEKQFACIVNSGSIFGIQCHPEKSHQNGIQLLKNFGEL